MCEGGQVEGRCGKIGGWSDESAPVNDSPGVLTAGQGHDSCHRMRGWDQVSTLVAAADGDEGVWGAGSRGSWGKGGVPNPEP